MPHVAFVPFVGFRVREAELRELGVNLPGFEERRRAVAQLPALGLLTLAGMTPPPWTCSYHEIDNAYDALVEQLQAAQPTLVAISALTASIDAAYAFSDRLRCAGLETVIGGLHATACPDEARQHCTAVVVGDGEPVWPQVLADAQRGELQPVYRASRPFDLSAAPLPKFDLLGPRLRPRLTLQTQRGCPLACEFCAASRLLGPFREKPIERIAAELRAICAFDARPAIELADDNTFVGSRDVTELFATLAAANVRYFTEADWRIGERPDLVQGLAASGCVQVLVGIESLIAQHAGMGPKSVGLPRVMDALQAIQASGVAVIGCFIAGCDGETRASLERLTQFVIDGPLADVQITLQTPFPGTALHRRLRRDGRLLHDRDWSAYTLFDVTYSPDPLTVGELERAYRDVLTTVFAAGPSARRRAIRKEVRRRNPRMRT